VVFTRPTPRTSGGWLARSGRPRLPAPHRLPRYEPAEVAIGIGDAELIARRFADQSRSGVGPLGAQEPAQVGDIRVQTGPRTRWRPLLPRGRDQGLDPDRPVAVDHQHGQHRPLLGCPQRQRVSGDGHLKRSEDPEIHPRLGHGAHSDRCAGRSSEIRVVDYSIQRDSSTPDSGRKEIAEAGAGFAEIASAGAFQGSTDLPMCTI
jgi:hypothetical protein